MFKINSINFGYFIFFIITYHYLLNHEQKELSQ